MSEVSDKQNDQINQTEKIKTDENFLSYKLLQNIILECDIPKKIIEEIGSELWYETLSGKGKIKFSNDIIYEGTIKHGMLESGINNEECILIFQDGTKYIGEIHNNKITGKGKYIFPTGATYTGDLYNGLRDGYGIYKSLDGTSYEGYWKNGLKNGKGIMKRISMEYNGEWLNGNINGLGKLKWDNGNIYEGYFNNNNIEGYGYMIWYDLFEKYIGNWKNNLQNGSGIHIWFEPKGELKLLRNRYIGQWVNGVRNGFGIFFYANGSVYEGEWKNNMKDGFGTFLFEDGKMYIGRFEEDRMIDFDNQLTSVTCDLLYNNFLELKDNILTIEREKREALEKEEDKHRKLQLKNVGNSPKKMSMISLNVSNFEKQKSILPNNESIKNKNLIGINKVESEVVTNFKENIKGIIKHNIVNDYPKYKSLNRYDPFLDLNDIILQDEDLFEDVKEIENILLRQLSDIKKCYSILLNIASGDLKEIEDFNSSKIIPERPKNKKSTKKLNYLGSNNIGINFLIRENPKSNDVSFCISMKDVWIILRESGIIGPDLTISDFDKFYYNGNNHYYNIYQIPDQINEPSEIYNYIERILIESRVNFVDQYYSYLRYYYRDKEIPSYFQNLSIEKRTEHSIHFKNHIILPRFFNECLVRAAYLRFLKIKSPLSQKLKKVIDSLIPPKKKVGKRNSLNRMDASFISIQFGESKKKIEERFQIHQFMYNYYSKIQGMFKKLYSLSTDNPTINDQTISYRFLYNNFFKKSALLMRLYPSKLDLIELIQYFFKDKITFEIEEIKEKSIEILNYVEKLFDNEIIEYEFFELIFLICRKYFDLKNLKGEKKDYESLLDKFEEIINLKPKKNIKKIYNFPELKNHNLKIQLIEKLKKDAEEEERKKKEIERYVNERKRLEREDENVFYEENESEEYSEEHED